MFESIIGCVYLFNTLIQFVLTKWPVDFRLAKQRIKLEVEKLEVDIQKGRAEISYLEAQTVKMRIDNLKELLEMVEVESPGSSLSDRLKSSKRILQIIKK